MLGIHYSPLTARFMRPNVGYAWPDVDIIETDDEFVFSFEIPGAMKDDVKIWLDNDVLSVSGEKKKGSHQDSAALVSERTFGKFERSFKLPQGVNRNKVSAEFVNGVLVVVVPKTSEAKPKDIVIN